MADNDSLQNDVMEFIINFKSANMPGGQLSDTGREFFLDGERLRILTKAIIVESKERKQEDIVFNTAANEFLKKYLTDLCEWIVLHINPTTDGINIAITEIDAAIAQEIPAYASLPNCNQADICRPNFVRLCQYIGINTYSNNGQLRISFRNKYITQLMSSES